MEKNLVEYRRIEGEGDESSFLKVMAVAITDEEEHKKIRAELDEFGFRYDLIESDIIVAKLYEGITPDGADSLSADDLVNMANDLEKKGWKW